MTAESGAQKSGGHRFMYKHNPHTPLLHNTASKKPSLLIPNQGCGYRLNRKQCGSAYFGTHKIHITLAAWNYKYKFEGVRFKLRKCRRNATDSDTPTTEAYHVTAGNPLYQNARLLFQNIKNA
jgi:hypothetical protein